MSNCPFLPIAFYIIVDSPMKEEKTKGGIIIPDDPAEKERFSGTTGKVLEIGPTAFGSLYPKKSFFWGAFIFIWGKLPFKKIPYYSKKELEELRIPQKGDIVKYKKYSGIEDEDKNIIYRTVVDEDIYNIKRVKDE